MMPKELIRDAVTDGFRVQVGWGGIAGEDCGYVQVATVNENSTLQLDDPLPEGESAQPFEGWFVHLDRAGINRMIRALRRARDSAHGADTRSLVARRRPPSWERPNEPVLRRSPPSLAMLHASRGVDTQFVRTADPVTERVPLVSLRA